MEKERLISNEEGNCLLELARYAIEGSQSKICNLPNISILTFLQEKRGIFVGLWVKDKLRGCIGSPFPVKPLEESVIECAIMATKEDSRFLPLKPEEIPLVQIEISILTAPKPIEVNQIQLGVHGLIVSKGSLAGLLLPQSTWIDDRCTVVTFLEQTCLKGGLQKDDWREGALIRAFNVQCFKEVPKD